MTVRLGSLGGGPIATEHGRSLRRLEVTCGLALRTLEHDGHRPHQVAGVRLDTAADTP